jgi:hypothetical protein
MPITRRSKPFTFSNGSQITLWEANWDLAMLRDEIASSARADKAKLNGKGDPVLLYFQEEIYSYLAGCSVPAPALEESFRLSDEDLDAWYEAAREVNPGLFSDAETAQQVVTFGDGSQITVLSANRPSVLRRLSRLDAQVSQEAPSENIRTETFRVLYYPKLAACSIGDVPSPQEARVDWPEAELNHWYEAVYAVNPEWFKPLEQIAEQNQARAQKAEKKRKRRPAKSSSS